MVFNKKAISPVVATALLLVVAVVAVVGFQGWYQTFQSGKLVDVQSQADSAAAVSIEAVSNSSRLYVRNAADSAITVSTVRVGNNSCDIVGTTASISGETTGEITLANCSIVATTAYDVFVLHDKGTVVEKKTAIQ